MVTINNHVVNQAGCDNENWKRFFLCSYELTRFLTVSVAILFLRLLEEGFDPNMNSGVGEKYTTELIRLFDQQSECVVARLRD